MRKVPLHGFEMIPAFSRTRYVISISHSLAIAHAGDIYDLITNAGETRSHFKSEVVL